MYTRILVPVDGSSFSNQILPWVDAIAKATGVQFALYRAVEQSDKRPDVEQGLRALAEAHGAQAVCTEAHGDVADAILKEAGRVPGTLVAITSHGRSGVMRAVLGSTALNVLRTGGNPILVYRPEEHPSGPAATTRKIERIFVPLDASPLSESIIPQAVELARWLKARLVVVSVIDPAAAGASGIAPSDVNESSYVHAQAARISREHGIDAGWEVLHGAAQEAIPQFVRGWPNSMLAMTTRGQSALQSALVGSVTAAALREGGVPVFARLP